MAYDLYPAVDEQYQFPPEIRMGLSVSPELRHGVVPMSTAQRNNLQPDELWEGRVISNTTSDYLERYDADSGQWYEFAYVFQVPAFSQVIQSFGSDAERDASIPVPVDGQVIWRSDRQWRQFYYRDHWIGDYGMLATTGTNHYVYGTWIGDCVLSATGDTQQINLNPDGIYAAGGSLLATVSILAVGGGSAYQFSQLTADPAAAKYRIWNQAGSLQVSKTINLRIIFLARQS